MREGFPLDSKREQLHNEHDAHHILLENAPSVLVRELLNKHESVFQDGHLKRDVVQNMLSEEYKLHKAVGLGEEEITQELERIFNRLLPSKRKKVA